VPYALARKYPNAPWDWRWQYVFAADGFSDDPRSGHARRHHLDEQHIQIRTVQALLGHAHVETTMIYTHVLNKGPLGVVSPLDTL